jgi:hypothetical protein
MMQLPDKGKKSEDKKVSHAPSKLLIALCIFTLFISLVSAGFCALVYANMSSEIGDYVQTHKAELKGDKGDTGPVGPQGFTGRSGTNGTNSYAPTHCYSSELFGSVSTNCY